MWPGMRREKVLYKNFLTSVETPQDLKFIYTSLIPIRNRGKNQAELNISNLCKNWTALRMIQDLSIPALILLRLLWTTISRILKKDN